MSVSEAENQQSSVPKPNATGESVTADERNLVVSFIQYLRQKVSANEFGQDQIEGIEVAVQCLEGVFNVSDKNYAFQPSKPLIQIFKEAEGSSNSDVEFPTPTPAEIEQANKLKEEGNELVKASKFTDAIQKYNEAIKLNRDPIYFCNRAAAYCRLDQNDLAIQDCRTALALDPKYAKAYGRMGVALSCQNRYDQAVEAYKHAIELDPTNESYKQNMAIAEEKLQEAQQAAGANPAAGLGGIPGLGGLPGMGGLGAMLNNPHMAQMAAEMMSNPNVQNMMGQMMSAFSGQGGAAAGGLDNLMRVGEQIAETLQQSNPELVESLRQQFSAARGPGGTDGSDNQDSGNNQQQPPPSS